VKLKEKLAIEATRLEVSCDESIRINDLARRMYLAGFEKAREMAADKIKNSIAPEGNEAFDTWVINQRLQAKHDHDLCLTLGEEEV